jgi:hypothetical protein
MLLAILLQKTFEVRVVWVVGISPEAQSSLVQVVSGPALGVPYQLLLLLRPSTTRALFLPLALLWVQKHCLQVRVGLEELRILGDLGADVGPPADLLPVGHCLADVCPRKTTQGWLYKQRRPTHCTQSLSQMVL